VQRLEVDAAYFDVEVLRAEAYMLFYAAGAD
jgi:hypothetical protein